MKHILLLSLAVIAAGCIESDCETMPEWWRERTEMCAESPRIKLSELVIRGEKPLYLHPRTFEPYTGPVVELHENSQVLKNWGVLEDGMKHGFWETYSETGKLLSKGPYQDGEPCGEWLENGVTKMHPNSTCFLSEADLFERAVREELRELDRDPRPVFDSSSAADSLT